MNWNLWKSGDFFCIAYLPSVKYPTIQPNSNHGSAVYMYCVQYMKGYHCVCGLPIHSILVGPVQKLGSFLWKKVRQSHGWWTGLRTASLHTANKWKVSSLLIYPFFCAIFAGFINVWTPGCTDSLSVKRLWWRSAPLSVYGHGTLPENSVILTAG